MRPGEIGTIADIEAAARAARCRLPSLDLDAQFRCGGSRAYEEWVLRLLGLEPGGPAAWEGDEHFSVSVADSPAAMESRLEADARAWLRRSDRRRLLLALERPRPGRRPRSRRADRGLAQAVEQQEADRRTPARPARPSGPATQPASSRSAASTPRRGSSTTTGVIIGPTWSGDATAWSPSQTEPRQPGQARGRAQFDRAVRNTYKVLLTRGMLGIASSTRPTEETQELLHSLVPRG